MRRQVASTPLDMAHDFAIADFHLDTSSNGVAIAAPWGTVAGSFETQTNPMIVSMALIMQKRSLSSAMVDGDIHSALVVIITHSHPTANMRFQEVIAGLLGYIKK